MSTFKEDQAVALAAAQREANLVTYKNWLTAEHPEVFDCIANLKMFQEYLDWEDEFKEADLNFALGNLKGRLANQKVPTPEQTKSDLIDTICSLIASTNGGRDGKYDEFNLKSEKIRMSHWTISQLTNRLEEIMRKQILAVKSASELKQIVAEARADTRKYPGFPTLGKTIVRPGTVRAVPLDAAYIKALDSFELKRFVRLYSAEQVNDRLAGRS
jgi:hypothetical protein